MRLSWDRRAAMQLLTMTDLDSASGDQLSRERWTCNTSHDVEGSCQKG